MLYHKIHQHKHPIAFALLHAGILQFDRKNGDYYARADDGEYVTLGCLEHEDALEAYLKTHPTGRYW